MINLLPPINFKQWIEDHREQLRPPVCNKVIWEDAEFIVMVVGGPNQRSDFHYDEGAEFFYQIEGKMLLRIMHETDNGNHSEDIYIQEGEIFMLPPKVPHSPQRFAGTVGLVVERKRLAHEKDGLMWYCQECGHKLYEQYFTLENIETQLPEVFAMYNADPQLQTCSKCGYHNQNA